MAAFDVVDLFAGPGGWDVAAHRMGLRVVGLELDAAACATRAAAGLVRALVDAGSDVLVDNTHLTPEQVEPLRAALAGCDVDWQVHPVHTPVVECLARDAERDQPVGQWCIRRLAAQHDAATAAGWCLTPAWLASGALEEVAA